MKLRTDRTTRKKLGRAGLAEVAAHLWPVDCQTCGASLDGERPALVVNDLEVFADASVHHSRCRAPEWDDSHRIVTPAGRLLTHAANTVLLPLQQGDDGEVGLWPGMLVNPGLESIPLTFDGARWTVATVESYRRMGLAPAGEDLNLDRPLPDAHGWLVGDTVGVQCQEATWTAGVNEQILERIHACGGLLLVVTSALHPAEVTTSGPLQAAIRAGQVAIGWVSLDPVSAPSAAAVDALLTSPNPPVIADGEPPSEVAYDGPTYNPVTGQFVMGQAADGPIHWTLHKPGHQVEHGLIAGPPEIGKTNVLAMVLVEALQSDRFVILPADPLDRNEICDTFGPAADRCARTVAETVTLLDAVASLIEHRRADAARYRDPTTDARGVLVAIDDADAVLRDQRAAGLAEQITTRGGPVGVGLVISTSSVDPSDFAGNTTLLRNLAATNAVLMGQEHFEFIYELKKQERDHPGLRD